MPAMLDVWVVVGGGGQGPEVAAKTLFEQR